MVAAAAAFVISIVVYLTTAKITNITLKFLRMTTKLVCNQSVLN